MELHLDMDEILSSKWEIYIIEKQNNAIRIACKTLDEIKKVCSAFAFCVDCPFISKKDGCCILRKITKGSPNVWAYLIRNYLAESDMEVPKIDE
jgi:hypothetical protein